MVTQLAGPAARRWLEDFARHVREQRNPVRVYLKQGCDAAAAGGVLRLHPNSVRYRIRQAEKKIGRPLAQRRVHVELALEMIGVGGGAS